MIGLAIAYLRDRPLTTALNVLLLAISVAMLVLLLQFGNQARDRFERDMRGIDLVVGSKGSPLQLILSSVFHVDQPTGNIPLSSLQLLRRDPAVKRTVPLALGDSFDGYRIVGTDSSFADLYKTKVASGRSFAAPMEAVLGAKAASETGADLGQEFIGNHGFSEDENGNQSHDHAPFKTVGILEATGTVVDRLILTSYESVWDVHGIAHADEVEGGNQDHGDNAHGQRHRTHSTATLHPPPDMRSPAILQANGTELEPELTALLVTYRNVSGAIRVPSMVNRQTEMQSAVPATETARLLALLGASIDGIRIFAWLLALTGGLAIFVALLNMARSREGDLALLRVMGASRSQVFLTIILEGLITAIMGAVVGWITAHSLISIARSNFPTLADLGLTPWQAAPAEAGLIAAVLAIGAFAALIPALRIYRIDPARTLARG